MRLATALRAALWAAGWASPVLAWAIESPVPLDVAAKASVLSVDGAKVQVSEPTAHTIQLSVLAADGAMPPFTSVIAPAAERGKHAGEPLTVDWSPASKRLTLRSAAGSINLDLAALVAGRLGVMHGANDPLYGIRSYTAFQTNAGGLLRQGTEVATAARQGFAGAPFVWSTAGFGVLVDAEGATFQLDGDRIQAHGRKGPIRTVYVFLGKPAELFAALADISGHSALFPKWAMGFTNSQWGIDEKELLDIVGTYRSKHIPIDNFTIDFDWKAWGEDDYGEFRWNASKFPDGPSGELKRKMDALGMHLTGIMKPRIHLDTVEGRYATEHGFWMPNAKAMPDYFSHKTVRDIDFDDPAARAWFFNDALKHSFDTGMVGWWNDEADDDNSDTEFENMQRALYEGQRAHSDTRVWSINRNFYLGSQRYAYGLWSGDIATGFPTMKEQRQRLLSAVNAGAMQWGMDVGGFRNGKPTPENYARWMQFGAFVPIFRVHGDFGQKRQPWVYGPVAEKAAAEAIRLRYQLIPYIYAYEHQRHVTGVGLVRPLLFDWPNDANVRDDYDAWLFGDSLLVSPVVDPGQTEKDIYLPAGQWADYASGKVYQGGQTIHRAIDAKTWSDIPLYIRDGAIIPMQPVMDYIGQQPVTQLDVEMFPARSLSQFTFYDDDGSTYAYEHGADREQSVSMQAVDGGVEINLDAPKGNYASPTTHYLLKIHGLAAVAVNADGQVLPSAGSPQALHGEGWAVGEDRFGKLTYVLVDAAKARKLHLSAGGAS